MTTDYTSEDYNYEGGLGNRHLLIAAAAGGLLTLIVCATWSLMTPIPVKEEHRAAIAEIEETTARLNYDLTRIEAAKEELELMHRLQVQVYDLEIEKLKAEVDDGLTVAEITSSLVSEQLERLELYTRLANEAEAKSLNE